MPLVTKDRLELIHRYAQGPGKLQEAFAQVPEPAQKWRPAPGRWSAHEVVCHCADAETLAASRIRFVLAEKDPLILGYDQDLWAQSFDYHNHPLEAAFQTIRAIRANTTALLERIPEEGWRKQGRHTESGTYGAEDWLQIYAEHLEKHARQIGKNAAAWRAQG